MYCSRRGICFRKSYHAKISNIFVDFQCHTHLWILVIDFCMPTLLHIRAYLLESSVNVARDLLWFRSLRVFHTDALLGADSSGKHSFPSVNKVMCTHFARFLSFFAYHRTQYISKGGGLTVHLRKFDFLMRISFSHSVNQFKVNFVVQLFLIKVPQYCFISSNLLIGIHEQEDCRAMTAPLG